MNIYRKICVIFSNFFKKKKKWAINIGTKSLKNRKSTSFYHQKRVNTYNRSIENKMVTQNIVK